MAAGIPEESGPGSTSPPATQGIPLVLPGRRRRFLLRPTVPFAPPGLRRASGLSAGLLLSGASTQVHGSMKQEEEEAERERSRPPRPRLGQEKRWETRGLPRPPPLPPGQAYLAPPPCLRFSPGLLNPGRARGPGVDPGVLDEGPGAAWGRGSGAAATRGRLGPGPRCPHWAGVLRRHWDVVGARSGPGHERGSSCCWVCALPSGNGLASG